MTVCELVEQSNVELSFGAGLAGESLSLRAAEVVERAAGFSCHLGQLGVRPGDRVMLIVPTGPAFVIATLAVWYVGASVVPLPFASGRGSGRRERRRLELALSAVSPAAVVFSERTSTTLEGIDLSGVKLIPEQEVLQRRALRSSPTRVTEPDHEALLQFTSGTGGRPQAASVTHRMLVAHANSSAEFAAVGSADSVVSWLPLFHDMGFVGGFVCPLVWKLPCHLLPTENFLQDPTIWLRVLSDRQATLTVTPPFALDLLARHAPDTRLHGVQLAKLRYVWVGSEPIHPGTLKAFSERFRPYGFRRHALKPCYGLAEATLAVTLTRAQDEYQTIAINRNDLRADGTARPTGTVESQVEFVSCGRRLPILDIQIIGPDGEILPDRRQGEVCLRGETVACAVVGSRARSSNDWYHTGDLGFQSAGEFYITGRRKDVIKRGGISLHPIELEGAVEGLAEVRAGGAVAFSIFLEGDKAERIVVVVESASGDHAAMLKAIRNAIVSEVGITIDEVIVVEPRTIPRTTSGKRMRQETRRMYESGELDGVAK